MVINVQAIAMAACYREEGPLLVVCPASMRLVWADELERWLPFLSPLDVHLGKSLFVSVLSVCTFKVHLHTNSISMVDGCSVLSLALFLRDDEG